MVFRLRPRDTTTFIRAVKLRPIHLAFDEPLNRLATPGKLRRRQFSPWLTGEGGAGILKAVPNDFLQRWPVSKRVNSSKADADDPTLIERVELATA